MSCKFLLMIKWIFPLQQPTVTTSMAVTDKKSMNRVAGSQSEILPFQTKIQYAPHMIRYQNSHSSCLAAESFKKRWRKDPT